MEFASEAFAATGVPSDEARARGLAGFEVAAGVDRRGLLVRTGLTFAAAALADLAAAEASPVANPGATAAPAATNGHTPAATIVPDTAPAAVPDAIASNTHPAKIAADRAVAAAPDAMPTNTHVAKLAADGATAAAAQAEDWEAVRGLFALGPDYLHFGGLYLASHPLPVRQAIDAYRQALDDNPVDYLHQHGPQREAAVLRTAAAYLGGSTADVALTDSTTMGLGLLYTGLNVRPDQELLTTHHDFYATHAALQLAAQRSSASLRQIALYQDIASATEDEIVDAVRIGVSERTRVLAVTWVHSSTGLKLPIRRIADVVADANQARDPRDRVLLCVDGVHGFGVEDARVAELGCDFFITGCHKWLFGPRGTGLVWGRGDQAWSAVRETIPTFGDGQTFGSLQTPGGFHSFEHRWALSAAFELHAQLGPTHISARIRALNTRLKMGLATISGVRLVTPLDDALSAGMVCFDVAGVSAQQVVDRLHARKIVATVTPYAVAYPRLAAGLLTNEEQVDAVVDAVRALAD